MTSLTLESLTSGLAKVPDDVRRFGHIPGGGVVFGAGVLDRLGEFCADQPGASHVLLVSDPGIAKAGHIERAVASIESADLRVTVFDDVHENPTTEDVGRAVEVAQAAGIDVLVGLGGGSSMDTAKGCNFLLTNGGEMKDYQGVGRATQPMLPFLAVPTTAGTGSECQSFALIADADSHMKMACGDKHSAAAIALLDPELTLTKPARVTAVTGIDAIAHALETIVCNKRSPVSMDYSRLAFALLDKAFERVLDDPSDLEARAQMQLGAAYAGTAIENSMLGVAHSCANPLSAHFDVVHGEAIGMMLPHVIRCNAVQLEIADIYLGLGYERLGVRVEELLEKAGLPRRLSEREVDPALIPVLAREAAEQWTAQFNPRALDVVEFEELYRAAL